MSTFGTLLREHRLRAGLGLRTFSTLVDERASAVSAIKSGRRGPWRREKTLQRVAQVLGAAEAAALLRKIHSSSDLAQQIPTNKKLLWWWASDEGPQLDRETVGELAQFVGAEPILPESVERPHQDVAWPSHTELAIE